MLDRLRVLITGIRGFVGSHFADHALANRAKVIGSYSGRSTQHPDNIQHIRDRIELINCDLRDSKSARELVEGARPDWVIHLAAQSSPRISRDAPADTLATNILCQANLLEAVRERAIEARFLVIGSSDEYGSVTEDELPIIESHPLLPLSPYAVSKIAQDVMGYQYFKNHGMHIVRSRAFNHEGRRRGDEFVVSSFARQIARIEHELQKPIVDVGTLASRRDFTDVRDIVRGYWLLLEHGKPGEVYNLCSGHDWTIRHVLDFLIGQSTVRGITERVVPALVRPPDLQRGDATKAREAVGWRPEIPFEQTLRDVLDDWRQRVP